MNKQTKDMKQISQEECDYIFTNDERATVRMHIDEKRITKAELIQVIRNQEDAIATLNSQILKNSSQMVKLELELRESKKKQKDENCTEVNTEELGDVLKDSDLIIANMRNIMLDRADRREKEDNVADTLQAAERIRCFCFGRCNKSEY